ncbi:tripartite tricarboxylate transporter permease [Pyrococcus yayanosii]|uniref:Hypothetical membrane protein n=1 Tax=Pyrococcus yayanosii (strain CH1 / JCM 16557) TaxID=529709 RepID=F8AH78_PYRYC|nr:tripartite tricarboxylate transporter permease [Pyrococcus yayanosii]AEH25308.1 hypothetical membrane protein [Pyrococcus yayanosii CH1]
MLGEFLKGFILGILTGLTPGLHVNALRRFNLAPATLFTMGTVHTFLDSVPSALFGVPEESTVPSVLPAHRLVLRGRFGEVVQLSLWASFFAFLLSIILLPIYSLLAPLYFPTLGKIAVLVLALLLILRQANRLGAALIFFFSGLLGIVAFSLPLRDPYYHVFTGIFALPPLLESLLNPPREVKVEEAQLLLPFPKLLKFSFFGTLLGALASLLPALTPGQASLLGSAVTRDDRKFLTVVYSTNTAAFAFSLANLALTGRARNGVMVAIGAVPINALPFLYLLGLSAGTLVLLTGPRIAFLVGRLAFKRYRIAVLLVLMFLVSLSLLYDGLLGLFLLAASSSLGLLPPRLRVRRITCMGVLMVPILLG